MFPMVYIKYQKWTSPRYAFLELIKLCKVYLNNFKRVLKDITMAKTKVESKW